MLYLKIVCQLILPHCFVMLALLYIKFLPIIQSTCIHSANTHGVLTSRVPEAQL